MVDDVVREIADLGADFEEFKRGNMGSYLMQCAERDEITALRKLADVDSDDKDAVYKLQLEAKIPKRVVQWIEDIINKGKTAKFQVEQEVGEY